jgi:hypothetical protein
VREDIWRVSYQEDRVRWVSARIMCLAEHPWVLQNQQSSPCGTEASEIRILAYAQWTDVLTGERDLQLHSYLRPRSLPANIAPLSVEHVMGGKFLFRFPRNLTDGRPVISSTEAAVEFLLSDGKTKWKMKFDLTEMVGPNGPDW